MLTFFNKYFKNIEISNMNVKIILNLYNNKNNYNLITKNL